VKIEFITEAAEDYKSLDGRIKKLVNIKMEKLEENPYIGEPLGNKNNIDLTGYYKIYIDKKKYRIVYRLVKNEIEIIEIWRIGKKDKMEIYKEIGKRISNKK
jgi:mRNA interferase RelE/StbE